MRRWKREVAGYKLTVDLDTKKTEKLCERDK
jgi:hypothetical protein